MARVMGLKERRENPAPVATSTDALRLQNEVIIEGRRVAQRAREPETMARLVAANANLRRKVGKKKRRAVGCGREYLDGFFPIFFHACLLFSLLQLSLLFDPAALD